MGTGKLAVMAAANTKPNRQRILVSLASRNSTAMWRSYDWVNLTHSYNWQKLTLPLSRPLPDVPPARKHFWNNSKSKMGKLPKSNARLQNLNPAGNVSTI
jgi:hypothetical protein